MIRAGVIHKVRWVKSSNKVFSSYINYIDRDEATRNYNFKDFSLYNDYMGNPKKSGSLFDMENDNFTESEIKNLKRKYSEAQYKGSLMWQEVFSFDNRWLEEQGLYNKENHSVDEFKIRNSIRETMKVLIDKENLNDLVWSASLHYNTDNIHVHIASVQLNNPKENGFRKGKTLSSMKNKFVNNLIDRNKEHKKINEIIRENIIDDKDNLELRKDRNMKKLIRDIMKELPNDTRQWHYNYNSMSDVRPKIDKLSKYYLENYKKEELKELETKLDEEVEFLKNTYGDGEKEKYRYKDYKENKINDLYVRLGNSFLNDIKDEVKKNKEMEKIGAKRNFQKDTFYINKRNLNMIKKSFNKDIENIKNQKRYRELEQEIEFENSNYPRL